MTVYVSADELLDLEHARLSLRRDHGVAVDRGRMVREAIARCWPTWTSSAGTRDRPPAGRLVTVDAADERRRRAQPTPTSRCPDQLRGPVRPAARSDRRHKLDVTEIALSRSPTSSSPTSGQLGAWTWSRPASSSWWRRRCSTSRPRGCCRRRRRGRGGPRAARGPGPAVRPAAAVPRVQAGGGAVRRAAAAESRRYPRAVGPGRAVRAAAARGGARPRTGRVRPAGRSGAGAEAAQPVIVAGPPARPAGQRPGAGCGGRQRLRRLRQATFRALVADAPDT